MPSWWAESHTAVVGATLTITGGTPTISMSGSRVFTPAPAVLTVTGSAPALGNAKSVQPAPAGLTITSGAPAVNKGITVRPTGAGLPATTYPYVFPFTFGQLNIVGRAPNVTATAQQLVTPTSALLHINGGVPIIPGRVKPVIVGVNTSATTSVTIPAHAVGNLILLYAFARNSVTPPSIPTPGGTVPAWAGQTVGPGSGICVGRTATFVATATNHTSGTWTGAFGMIAVVVSGQAGIGGAGADGGSTLDCTAPAITMSDTSGVSLLAHFFGARSGSASAVWGSPPAGYTQSATDSVVCMDVKTDTHSDGSVTQTRTGATPGFDAHTIEILAP